MKKMKGIRTLLTVAVMTVLLTVSLVVMTSAGSNDHSDNSTVQKYQQQLADYDKKIKDSKKKISALGDDIDALFEEKEEYDTLVETVNGKIEMSEKYKAELTAELEQLDADIAEKERECETLYEQIKERMRISYENSEASTISLILGAESLTDFLIALDYTTSIFEYDNRMLADYETKQSELEAVKATRETDKAELEELIVQLEADKVELQTLSTKCETLISDKMTDLESEEKILAAMESDKEKKAQALDKYIEELEKKQGQTQNVAEGKFIWPVPVSVSRISSQYGYRKDPFTGERKFHSGIDIPGKSGTAIYAANNGTVLIAEKDGSYGNYILVDHGGGIYTLYAHCKKLLVSVGDRVSKGQQIAQMGTTGRSTGNHLHFEVREGKNRVNPLNYVTQP